jgi:acetyl esterase/lipase
VVICPGGGYGARAPHEGRGYAEYFNTIGMTAFVCQYRVSPHRFPLPLLDIRRCIRFVRANAEKFGIDPNKVAVMGSSAGGHLAAMTSTYHEPIPELEGLDEIDRESGIPNGQILCYALIALLGKDISNPAGGRNLLGENHAEMGEELSPHLIADENAPRAFMWHTFEDAGVSMNNSLLYAKCLRDHGVSTEVHIYPKGGHGLGLAENLPHTRNWSRELLEWLFLEEPSSEV